MKKTILIGFILWGLSLSLTPAMAFKFSIGGKKSEPKNPPIHENIEDDEDYIDRSQKDLTQLESKEFTAHGVVDDVGVFRIKAMLQDHEAVFKVNHMGFDKYYIYFNKGEKLSDDQISALVKTAGFKVSGIKFVPVSAKK